MGCQDILENVPGRSKAASVTLPGWSPSETRSSFMSRTSKSKSGSSRNLLKTDDLSSSVTRFIFYHIQIKKLCRGHSSGESEKERLEFNRKTLKLRIFIIWAGAHIGGLHLISGTT